jgi:hypothetical protein
MELESVEHYMTQFNDVCVRWLSLGSGNRDRPSFYHRSPNLVMGVTTCY